MWLLAWVFQNQCYYNSKGFFSGWSFCLGYRFEKITYNQSGNLQARFLKISGNSLKAPFFPTTDSFLLCNEHFIDLGFLSVPLNSSKDISKVGKLCTLDMLDVKRDRKVMYKKKTFSHAISLNNSSKDCRSFLQWNKYYFFSTSIFQYTKSISQSKMFKK